MQKFSESESISEAFRVIVKKNRAYMKIQGATPAWCFNNVKI